MGGVGGGGGGGGGGLSLTLNWAYSTLNPIATHAKLGGGGSLGGYIKRHFQLAS